MIDRYVFSKNADLGCYIFLLWKKRSFFLGLHLALPERRAATPTPTAKAGMSQLCT
jgi:hypothetical protein